MPDMPDTQRPPQRPATPALVLLDSSFRPVSYNAEAIRILTYVRDSVETHPIAKLMETQLRSILAPLGLSHRDTLTPTFRSGRRQYIARMFALNNHRNGSLANDPSPAHALLLERQDRKLVDLSTIAEQFHLTPRERETVHYLAEGMTSNEIGERMGISPHTVKAFFRLIMSKMQVSTRSGIIGKIVRIST